MAVPSAASPRGRRSRRVGAWWRLSMFVKRHVLHSQWFVLGALSATGNVTGIRPFSADAGAPSNDAD